MLVKLSLDSVDDYKRFLKIKSLPRYEFRGRVAYVPDEYAHLIDAAPARTEDAPYEPLASLFDYQRDITALALRRRKFAVFADPGLGKTLIMLDYARHVSGQLPPGKAVLIVSPLMVVRQTLAECARFFGDSLPIEQVKAGDLGRWLESGTARIGITNYEGLKATVDQGRLGSLILDESSLLKSAYGKFGTEAIRLGRGLDWKLALTGTPAPNDRIEYANHSVFLDAFPTVNSFLARFFVNRGQTQNRWELKPHALRPFYRAISHWCIFLSDPATYGWKDNVATLPPIHVHIHRLDMTDSQRKMVGEQTGMLFPVEPGGIVSRSALSQIAKGSYKGESVETLKPEFIKSLVTSWPDESTIIWCHHNDEQKAIARLFPDAGNITGTTPYEKRASIIESFQAGRLKTLVSKPKLLGWGLNLQICTQMIFNGTNDCYDEQTEILTPDGWRSFGEVSVGQDVATVNPETYLFEWQQAERVIWNHYDGPMLRFNGQRNFDLLVTPNHKLFVQRCPTRHPSSDGRFGLMRADEIAGRFRRQEYRMLSACDGFRGERPDHVSIPPYESVCAVKNILSIPATDMAKLIGWYVSEGYCRPEGSAEFSRIVICQSDQHPENRAEIIGLLEGLGLHVNSKTKDITCYCRNLAVFLMRNFGTSSETMHLPRWVKDWDAGLLTIVRDTLIKGDGCHHGATPHSYRTISKSLADDFQEICIKTGVRASVHHQDLGDHWIYDVSLAWQHTRPSIFNEPEEVPYSGMIGCVTVPNHVVIVRRNGIAVLSGNSWEEWYQAIKRANRIGSTRPLNVHAPITELEEPMLRNVLGKADRIEQDTLEHERIFRDAARLD